MSLSLYRSLYLDVSITIQTHLYHYTDTPHQDGESGGVVRNLARFEIDMHAPGLRHVSEVDE